jgi:hypothetical protein
MKKKFILSVFLIFILGSLFHFTYDLTNHNFIVGLFCPINESVWEHTKLSLTPIFIWYLFTYLSNKSSINGKHFFTSGLISIIISIILIPTIFYFYTGTFGIESVVIDILILFVADTIGQYYAYRNRLSLSTKFLILLYTLIFILYFVFTIYPPNIPIFISAV